MKFLSQQTRFFQSGIITQYVVIALVTTILTLAMADIYYDYSIKPPVYFHNLEY